LRDQIGLALYTVRDLMEHDFERVLGKVAAIGYREVEPANGFNDMSPKAFRAMLDKYKLKCPSTHSAPVLGSDLERQWEGFQAIGIQYSREPTAPRPPRAPGVSLGQYMNRNSFLEVEAFGPVQPRLKIDDAKWRAAKLNEQGKLSAKFGIKLFIHNHTGEFEKLVDSPKTEWDIYLEETDPSLVTFQLDLGWARIAGVDPIDLFKKSPGRYELWHIKDLVGLKTVNQSLSPNERTSSMAFTPVGRGQIDWRPYFAQAELAGMKHFYVEQDNASTFGDSLAAARVSYESLAQILG
jgi:sugar phosphate isomerase/epimerase